MCTNVFVDLLCVCVCVRVCLDAVCVRPTVTSVCVDGTSQIYMCQVKQCVDKYREMLAAGPDGRTGVSVGYVKSVLLFFFLSCCFGRGSTTSHSVGASG